jgi:hypothetical protein
MVTPSRGTGRAVDTGAGLESSFPTHGWDLPGTSARPPSSGTGRIPWPASLGPRALQGFGLSPREARLYLALVTQGPIGARRATEGSGLHRATAYRVLSRLLARGLVRAERRWPREYSPIPLRVLVERHVSFLRDEIELRHWLLRAFPAAPDPAIGSLWVSRPDRLRCPPPDNADRVGSIPMGVTAIGSVSDSPLLDQLQGARRGVDALIRPLMIPSGLRSKIAASLARTAARGLPVRVVLDYLAADRRFAALFRRERSPRVSNLEVRHFTPLGGHFYVIDGRAAVRFPILTGSTRDPDFGFVSEDRDFVGAQVTRFEAVWDDAVARRLARVLPDPEGPVATPVSEEPPRAYRPTVGEVRTMPAGGAMGRAQFR